MSNGIDSIFELSVNKMFYYLNDWNGMMCIYSIHGNDCINETNEDGLCIYGQTAELGGLFINKKNSPSNELKKKNSELCANHTFLTFVIVSVPIFFNILHCLLAFLAFPPPTNKNSKKKANLITKQNSSLWQ